MVYLLDAWSDADCCLSLCVVQEVHSGRFAMYDYGNEKTNRQHYGVVSQVTVSLGRRCSEICFEMYYALHGFLRTTFLSANYSLLLGQHGPLLTAIYVI